MRNNKKQHCDYFHLFSNAGLLPPAGPCPSLPFQHFIFAVSSQEFHLLESLVSPHHCLPLVGMPHYCGLVVFQKCLKLARAEGLEPSLVPCALKSAHTCAEINAFYASHTVGTFNKKLSNLKIHHSLSSQHFSRIARSFAFFSKIDLA